MSLFPRPQKERIINVGSFPTILAVKKRQKNITNQPEPAAIQDWAKSQINTEFLE